LEAERTGNVIEVDCHGGDERRHQATDHPLAEQREHQDHGQRVRRLVEQAAGEERVARPPSPPVGDDERDGTGRDPARRRQQTLRDRSFGDAAHGCKVGSLTPRLDCLGPPPRTIRKNY
jgi:hypothetical protein